MPLPKDREVTKGDLKRLQDEQKRKDDLARKQEEIKSRMQLEKARDTVSGSFKRIITDAYVSTLSFNYGDEVNFDHIDRCFNFSCDVKNGQIIPSFKFNENAVEFKSDDVFKVKNFNQNARKDFISEEEYISGDILKDDNFISAGEKSSYDEGNGDNTIKEGPNSVNDGRFIVISYEDDRYGKFNKIHKTRGYATLESVKSMANEQAEKVWNAQKKNIFKKLEGGF